MSTEERREQIALRAYAIWEREGCPNDRALAHWLQAEAELYDFKAESRSPLKSKSKRRP